MEKYTVRSMRILIQNCKSLENHVKLNYKDKYKMRKKQKKNVKKAEVSN